MRIHKPKDRANGIGMSPQTSMLPSIPLSGCSHVDHCEKEHSMKESLNNGAAITRSTARAHEKNQGQCPEFAFRENPQPCERAKQDLTEKGRNE
jgi:hypothetical protein